MINNEEIFEITSNYSTRLDILLSDSQNLSRNHFRKLIKDGFVTVNDNLVRKTKFKVNIGDKIKYREFKYVKDLSDIVPQRIKINIIYEDENIIVVNKPEGLVVHPAAGNQRNTLLNGIIFKLKFEHILNERPGVVHRLDKKTSGVIIFAKNEYTLNFLINQFKSREVEKKYLVLVKGIVNPNASNISKVDNKNFYIKGNIKRSKYNRKLFTLSDTGKEAITYFKIIKYINKEFTLLEAYPKTGRTHQIRVSLSSINHPVVGDDAYSRNSISYPHMFLHSYSLKINIPDKGEQEFKANLPNFWKNIPGVYPLYKV
jgi:23S rRNA pseudouridine1911/1915/1917 synthase